MKGNPSSRYRTGSILLKRTRENYGGSTRSLGSADLAIHRSLIKVIVGSGVGSIGVGSIDALFTDVKFVLGKDISCLVSSEVCVEIADVDGIEKPDAIAVESDGFGVVDVHIMS